MFSFLLNEQHLCFPFGIRFWYLQRCSVLSVLWSTFCVDLFLWCFSPSPCLSLQALAILPSHLLCFLPWCFLCSLTMLSLSGRRQRQGCSLLYSYRLTLILGGFLGQGGIPLVWITPLGQPESDLMVLIHRQWMDGSRLALALLTGFCVPEPDLSSILVLYSSFSNFWINAPHGIYSNIHLDNKLQTQESSCGSILKCSL